MNKSIDNIVSDIVDSHLSEYHRGTLVPVLRRLTNLEQSIPVGRPTTPDWDTDPMALDTLGYETEVSDLIQLAPARLAEVILHLRKDNDDLSSEFDDLLDNETGQRLNREEAEGTLDLLDDHLDVISEYLEDAGYMNSTVSGLLDQADSMIRSYYKGRMSTLPSETIDVTALSTFNASIQAALMAIVAEIPTDGEDDDEEVVDGTPAHGIERPALT